MSANGQSHSSLPLRVLTYNVHRCLGTDRCYHPGRIAEVIAECDPDVVALQELDAGRKRSGGIHQAEHITAMLGMASLHYHAPIEREGERYGHALLTRAPSRLVREGPLPGARSWRVIEPRGAVWIELEHGVQRLQIFNTHFGLGRRERLVQVTALLGPSWIGDPAIRPPILLLGDLNSLPGGPVHRAISAQLRDLNPNGAPSFPTYRPLIRIDHIFASDDITAQRAGVHRSPLARRASDHYPVLADLLFDAARDAG
jgi:endonuclease/exonuclease/phosphatase family metal-dependent hydrolase